MKKLPHHSTLRPGEDASLHMAHLYEEGRHFPHGKSALDLHGRSHADAKLPKYHGGDGLELDARNHPQAPQDPADEHGPQYDNDVSSRSWLRGGADAPHFDHSGPSGSRYRK
jgi:hypothetical protein